MIHCGQRLLLARRNRKLTQTALAKQVGLNLNTISRAERSTVATLSGYYIARLAQTLDVSADYLLGLDEAATPQLAGAMAGE